MIKPFVKWAGGKQRLLKHIKPLLPKEINNFIEPFVGGGAVFLNVDYKKAIINDINKELILTYKIIKKDYKKLIEKLREFKEKDSYDFFTSLRKLDREPKFDNTEDVLKAARFIFLNKTCYGGLYRVNSKGHFNVPYAKNINGKKFFDEKNFQNVSKKLKNTRIYNKDYLKIFSLAKKGDFVFIDPPYLPSNEVKNTFNSYNKKTFTINDHKKLSLEISKLTKKGVWVMATNHSTSLVKKIYKNLNFIEIKVTRTISCSGQTKSGHKELIMTNYVL